MVLASLSGFMVSLCLMVLSVLYLSLPAQTQYTSVYPALENPSTEPMAWTVRGMPTIITTGSTSWTAEPSGGFSLYSTSSVRTIPLSTFAGEGVSSTFTFEDVVIPTTAWTSSTRSLMWVSNESTIYGYDAVSGNVLTSFAIVTSDALANLSEISFKAVILEPAGNSIMAVATPVAMGMAMVGSSVYRLEHFVGRVAITSLSVSREVSMLLVLISLMAVFLLRTLHLHGSYGPGGFTVVASITTWVSSVTTGSSDSSTKERTNVYQRPQRILGRMAV